MLIMVRDFEFPTVLCVLEGFMHIRIPLSEWICIAKDF
jgi:hypothetical protein